MATIILTDSSADYEQHELQRKNVGCVPLTIAFGDEAFLDGVELSKDEFYTRLLSRTMFPTTSQPSPEAFLPYFKQAKQNGDEVVAILLSGGLSGTVQSATIARQMTKYNGIHIVDSLSTVAGLRLLVDAAVDMRNAGLPAQKIADTIEALKHRITIFAVVDTLEYLHRGGRLTKAQARLGQMISVKPIISLNDEGKLFVLDKALGFAAACKTILKYFADTPLNREWPVLLAYSHNDANVRKMQDMLKTSQPDITVRQVCDIGPVIGTHLGDNAFGIIYIRQ